MKKRISVFVLTVFLLSLILGSMTSVYAVPPGTILYQSDFDNASTLADAGLSVVEGELSAVRFENGKMILDNLDNTDADVFFLFEPSLALPDGIDQFTIEWDYTYLDGTGPRRYLAPLWFYFDTDNYSGTWHRAESNHFTVDVKHGGSFSHYDNLGEFDAADFGITGGTGVYHTSKIIYDRGVVTAYVDDVLIGSGSNENEVFGGEFAFMIKVETAVEVGYIRIYTGTEGPIAFQEGARSDDDYPEPTSNGGGEAMGGGEEADDVTELPRPTPRTGDAGTVALVIFATMAAATGIVIFRRKAVR
jgi:LPXTG-motif cell wall-anchored protein